MRRRVGPPSKLTLIFLAAFSLVLFGFVEFSKSPRKQRNYEEKLNASRLASRAALTIRTFRVRLGYGVDPENDPNGTGLIGIHSSPLTTGYGDIETKLTSTDPNFGAAAVRMLKNADLKKGDTVAVSLVGSYPALNIAILAAIEVLELEPVIITAVSSTPWGANLSGLTWLDMERHLVEKGLFRHKSVAASIGGTNDNGRGLPPEGREEILATIARNGTTLIQEDSLAMSINARMEIYRSHGRPKAYINVGRSIASLGGSLTDLGLEPGVYRRLNVADLPDGVLRRMVEQRVPLINVVRVEKIAEKYGIPIAAVPLPEIGYGNLYYRDHYSPWLAALCTVILVFSLLFFIRVDVRHLLTRKE